MDSISQLLRDRLNNSSMPQSKSIELTPEEHAQKEVDIFNSVEGKLTGYDCKICKNRGFIHKVGKNEWFGSILYEPVSEVCSCMKVRDLLRRAENSGIANLLKRYTFRNYFATEDWQKSIYQSARKFAKNPVGWFFIGGQPGCGKTHICTAMVGNLLKQGKSAKYMLWQEDITTLKQMINDEYFNNLISPFLNADILYIDDFFKTKENDRNFTSADVRMTFRIINHRLMSDLPTIISSELSTEEIISIDEGLGSRIVEVAKDNCIYIGKDKNKNYRYKVAKNEKSKELV